MATASTSVRKAVDAVDLDNTYRRLSKEWPVERVVTAMEEYRKFLMMVRCGIKCSPCPDVDRVWHDHLLHTRQYAEDCQRLFGEFLHHTPSTGSVEEAKARSVTYQAMLKSYRELFGQEHAIWGACPPSIVAPPTKRARSRSPVTFDGCDC